MQELIAYITHPQQKKLSYNPFFSLRQIVFRYLPHTHCAHALELGGELRVFLLHFELRPCGLGVR